MICVYTCVCKRIQVSMFLESEGDRVHNPMRKKQQEQNIARKYPNKYGYARVESAQF